MPDPDFFGTLIRPLNASGIRYMLTGAYAAGAYGEPRLTNDLDVVVQIGPAEVTRLVAAFPTGLYYVPPVEVIREEAARTRFGHFNIMHLESAMRADVYVAGDDAANIAALAARVEVELHGEAVYLVPPEYLIAKKLEYVREGGGDHHLRDIAGILRVSGHRLDHALLDRLVRSERVEREWARVPKPIAP